MFTRRRDFAHFITFFSRYLFVNSLKLTLLKPVWLSVLSRTQKMLLLRVIHVTYSEWVKTIQWTSTVTGEKESHRVWINMTITKWQICYLFGANFICLMLSAFTFRKSNINLVYSHSWSSNEKNCMEKNKVSTN